MTEHQNSNQYAVLDGNEACVTIAYKCNELCIIYPITPASNMGEMADIWSGNGKENVFGTVPEVVTMHSEAGVAGAIHGALQNGALANTFTSSQGLLLMIPNMYRISGELTPTVFHVASRVVAYQGMSIYCDHSDVMSIRATGFAMLASSSVQEAHDMALIAEATSLKSRIPFFHFFDGMRTSHALQKIELLKDSDIEELLDEDDIKAHRDRALTPEHPSIRGEVQNSDIFFQAREAVTPFYKNVPEIMQNIMNRFATLTGRDYSPLQYYGAPDATKIIMVMTSGAETVIETVDYLVNKKQKVGVIKVRLFRPFPAKLLCEILPKTVKKIAVLDRYKESGAAGEPLMEEVSTALYQNLKKKRLPKIVGGRFGIAAKEFTPGMVKGIFDELKKPNPKQSFTIGINDDVSDSSLDYDDKLDIEPKEVTRAIFYGLGADGTIGANKNSAKIIGETTELFVQAYFLYDSKKSGSKTISHLRFGPNKIRSEYLIQNANFVGCHQFNFVTKSNVLAKAKQGATFLLNSFYSKDEVWQHLPRVIQDIIIQKKLKFYVIDAYKVAEKTGMGRRINTIMQTCFFALSGVLPRDVAIEKIKAAAEKSYAKKGAEVVEKNLAAIDATLANLYKVKVPKQATSNIDFPNLVPDDAPQFVREVTNAMFKEDIDALKVSKIPVDGTYPTHTTKYEKRNISHKVASWQKDLCIECGQCNMVCPHSAIRAKHYSNELLKTAPDSFASIPFKDPNLKDESYTIQVYPEDCTGCEVCINACPVKALSLTTKDAELVKNERLNVEFFNGLPNKTPVVETKLNVKKTQFLPPMFEFCSACAGCGEAPYVRLLTQLFGDRLLIANACGCSSVYCGNLPTSPFTKDSKGHGPAWNSSLFEDNAEFGYGMALSTQKLYEEGIEFLEKLKDNLPKDLIENLTKNPQQNSEEVEKQRDLVGQLKTLLNKNPQSRQQKRLLSLCDHLVKPSVWAYGGDGWAYDIGFAGLDHVIASGRKMNLLVMDTEVYSNTGGQASKASPRGAVVKFAAHGKKTAKKELGLMAMTYGDVYVAHIALGANPNQAIKALIEAEQYPGASLVIAYSPCIAHGYEMKNHLTQQKLAVKSGYWALYRYNPLRKAEGLNPFQLDSAPPSIPLEDYMYNENRFRILKTKTPEVAKKLLGEATQDVKRLWEWYNLLKKDNS